MQWQLHNPAGTITPHPPRVIVGRCPDRLYSEAKAPKDSMPMVTPIRMEIRTAKCYPEIPGTSLESDELHRGFKESVELLRGFNFLVQPGWSVRAAAD